MNPIISLQKGGDISSLFVDYKPFTGLQEELTATAKSEKTTTTKEKDSEDGFKELLGLLKELNGLPGDTAYISSHIEKLYSRAMVLGNGEISRKELVSTYLKALRSIRQALHSKEEYKSVRQNITSKHGENEIAIDNHGNLFVLDINTGEIKNMSPEQYNKIKSRGQYQALTNSNLLHYRANDPQFAFNDNILQVVANGTSMEEINKYLTEITSKIGTTTLKREGYSEAKAGGIIKGMASLEKAFLSGMSVEGLYHQEVLTKEQMELAKLALEYLWKTLPSNAKALLKVKGGSEEGAKLLIQDLIFSELDYESTVPKDKNKKDKDKTDKIDDDGIKNTEALGFYFGMGEIKLVALVPNSDYGYAMTARAGVLTGHSGEALKEYDTLADVASGAYAGMLDIDNATFGGASIDTLSKVFLRNSTIYSVELPIDVAYKNSTGKVRPDITLAQRMSQLNKAIQDGEIDRNNINQINAKCKELNLPEKYIGYDDQGHPILNGQVYSRFARIAAFIDENSLENEDDVQGWARNLATDQERKNFLEHMKTVDKNYKLSSGIWGSDDLYDGIVFIPIRESVMAATYGGGEYYKYPSENAITAELKDRDNRALNTYVLAPTLNSVKK